MMQNYKNIDGLKLSVDRVFDDILNFCDKSLYLYADTEDGQICMVVAKIYYYEKKDNSIIIKAKHTRDCGKVTSLVSKYPITIIKLLNSNDILRTEDKNVYYSKEILPEWFNDESKIHIDITLTLDFTVI